MKRGGSVMLRRSVSSYSVFEVHTQEGQCLYLKVPSGVSTDEVKRFFGDFVTEVEIPRTHTVNVQHGGYGEYSRYAMKQHEYLSSDCEAGIQGYTEVLEIVSPPEGRHGILIHDYRADESGHCFSEWTTLKSAKKAHRKVGWQGINPPTKERFPELLRFVPCGPLTPWFYATGDEELIGDYALSHGFSDDPVFRLGQKFVVPTLHGPAIKTCMGSLHFMKRSCIYPHPERPVHLISWSDGTTSQFEEDDDAKKDPMFPRPLREDELWIEAAMAKFRAFLAGTEKTVRIQLTDGSEFVGRLREPKGRVPTLSGKYVVEVLLEGESASRRGEHDFELESGEDLAQYIARKTGKRVIRFNVLSGPKNAPDGRKWKGVFYGAKRTRKR